MFYETFLIVLLHLCPLFLLAWTWKLPSNLAESRIVLGQGLACLAFLVLYPVAACLSWPDFRLEYLSPVNLLGFWSAEALCFFSVWLITSAVVTCLVIRFRRRSAGE